MAKVLTEVDQNYWCLKAVHIISVGNLQNELLWFAMAMLKVLRVFLGG